LTEGQPYPTQPAPAYPQQAQQPYSSYYAQRAYGYGYAQPPAAQPQPKPTENMQPIYIGLGLIAVVAIIAISMMAFGGKGEERVDPALLKLAAEEEARVLIYCETRCNEDAVENMGGTVLTRFDNENAILILIKGSEIESLSKEKWVKKLASPM